MSEQPSLPLPPKPGKLTPVLPADQNIAAMVVLNDRVFLFTQRQVFTLNDEGELQMVPFRSLDEEPT